MLHVHIHAAPQVIGSLSIFLSELLKCLRLHHEGGQNFLHLVIFFSNKNHVNDERSRCVSSTEASTFPTLFCSLLAGVILAL